MFVVVEPGASTLAERRRCVADHKNSQPNKNDTRKSTPRNKLHREHRGLKLGFYQSVRKIKQTKKTIGMSPSTVLAGQCHSHGNPALLSCTEAAARLWAESLVDLEFHAPKSSLALAVSHRNTFQARQSNGPSQHRHHYLGNVGLEGGGAGGGRVFGPM